MRKAAPFVCAVLLGASAALAAPTPAPPPQPRWALTITAATFATLATSVAAGLAGWTIPGLCFGSTGRPDPLCSTGGIFLGGAMQLGLAVLLVPEVLRLGDDAGGHGSVDEARASTWRYTRWAALAAGVFALAWATGAVLERTGYGRGQAPMLVGGAGLAASWLAFDVLAIVGATRGYRDSRVTW